MKTIIKTTAIAICTFIATAVQAQKIDWANAPINPIPFEYTITTMSIRPDLPHSCKVPTSLIFR